MRDDAATALATLYAGATRNKIGRAIGANSGTLAFKVEVDLIRVLAQRLE